MFKPAGIPASELERTVLTREEIEALRLIDAEGLDQTTAAEKMNISQPTLSRELALARRKVADALLNGKAIELGGENMPNSDGTGPQGKGAGTGRGLGGCKGEPKDEQQPLGLGQGKCMRERRGTCGCGKK